MLGFCGPIRQLAHCTAPVTAGIAILKIEQSADRASCPSKDSSSSPPSANSRNASAVWHTAVLALAILALAGCDPPYLSDTYAASTPKSDSFDTKELAHVPVAVLAFVAPGNLQGLSPMLSLALSDALAKVTPPIRGIPTDDVLNRLTDQGLAAEYADLRAGFARNGILDRHRLRRIGLGLGAQYVLLPGVAQFDEEILDKFEAAGIKLLRNRVTALRIWLQLWDVRNGHIVWESSGEVTVSTVFLSPKQTVALEQIAKKLLTRMIQDGLLESKTESEVVQDH